MKLLLNQARRHYHFYSSSRCLQVRWFSSDPNAKTARIEHPGSLGATPLQQSQRLPPSENMRSLLDFAGISGYGMARLTVSKPRLSLGSSEDEKMVHPTDPKSRMPFGSSEKDSGRVLVRPASYQPPVNLIDVADIIVFLGHVFVEALKGQHYPYVSGSEKPSALSTCNWCHSILRFFFYWSELTPSFTGIAALALSYHIFMGVRHLLAESSGFRFLRIW